MVVLYKNFSIFSQILPLFHELTKIRENNFAKLTFAHNGAYGPRIGEGANSKDGCSEGFKVFRVIKTVRADPIHVLTTFCIPENKTRYFTTFCGEIVFCGGGGMSSFSPFFRLGFL